MIEPISSEKTEKLPAPDLLQQLQTTEEGLASQQARQRLEQFGPNRLHRERSHPLLNFLGYFWGPIPWMIEVAALLSALARHWPDLIIILVLLLFNASLGFWQEHKAANALDALRRQLALKARVRRDGQWQEIDADELVPGDIIRLRLGAIVPADAKLLGGDYLSVDQSALTGESLPVDKKSGDVVYSGSVTRQGDMTAVVTATAEHTFFARTAKLVESAGAVSHFQKAVLSIGDYLIYISLALVVMLVVAQLFRDAPFLELVQFALILTVASIPVAMPAVLSVTMAVGAMVLSKQQAIVSRLESIEEMAGIDVLCSDKTGTLTQNRLTLGEPALFEARTSRQLIEAAALASQPDSGDAIDEAVIAGLADKTLFDHWPGLRVVPFDPVSKRTEITRRGPQGEVRFSKGAPRVMLDLTAPDAEARARAEQLIDGLAAKGYRTLGVARSDDGKAWHFLGLLSLYDPPREDSAQTLQQARKHGIRVKLITGDDLAIGREMARQLGLGTDIQPAGTLFDNASVDGNAALWETIEKADGFAQVFPEHKYTIVKALQQAGHRVAMTGDGVNDAPALKQADAGIAVSGATDAARAAADLILAAPGLSVIVGAVEEARRIYERMNAYAIYRTTETLGIMLFVVLAMLTLNFYPITAVMIILLAFLNDVPIMAIAYDNTAVDPLPVRWDTRRVLTIATVQGLVAVSSSFILLLIARQYLKLDIAHLQTLIFLKLAVAGHMTLFVSRNRSLFWRRPFPSWQLGGASAATTTLATLLAVYPMGLLAPLSWGLALLVWGYSLAWMLVMDIAKAAVARHFDRRGKRHRAFLDIQKRALQPRTGHHR